MATHLSTVARSPEDLLERSRTGKAAREQFDEDFPDEILMNPEVKKLAAESVQKLVEDWVHQKIPALGNRTPLQAVRDPEGKEIVKSLLLEWERGVEDGLYLSNLQPDLQAVRKLLDLGPPTLG